MPSSPGEPRDADRIEPVELFLIGRTLRGTLGEAFRREVVGRFETEHGGHGRAVGGDRGGDGHPPRSSISRTVELTAVAVTRADAVSVDLGIADPAFRSSPAARAPAGTAVAGETVFEVAVDGLEGIRPVAGPPGVDRSRRAVVRVRCGAARDVRLRVTVVPTG